MAKAVLTAMLVYHMQIVWIPQGVCDEIDQTITSFIWRRGGFRAINLVSRETITKPKQEGELGLHRARETNITMIEKVIIELHGQTDKLW